MYNDIFIAGNERQQTSYLSGNKQTCFINELFT